MPFAEATGSLPHYPGAVQSRKNCPEWKVGGYLREMQQWHVKCSCTVFVTMWRSGGQHLNIKRQCICSTDLNAEMVPALKNKSIMKQSNEEMCVNTNYSLRFREDSEILMHCQLLQRRLYNLDSFLCHKMHPTV